MTERLLVVVPVFNEEDTIDVLLRRLDSTAANVVGVVVVDDGSEDTTCARIEAFRSKHGVALHLIRLARNFGHQNAVIAGLAAAERWAREDGITFVGLIDGDLQDRPEDFVALMQHAADVDVVYGARQSRREGIAFRVIAKFFYRLLSGTSRLHIPRDAGTFSVMRVHVVRAILENADRSPYLPGLRSWVGFRQTGVPLARQARHAGSSRVGFGALAALAIAAIFTYSNLPLRLLLLISMLTLGVSTTAATVMLCLKLAGLLEVQGTALIVTSIFFSLGVQSVYLAIIAYMIGRTTAEASRRNSFVVMEEKRVC